MSKPVWALPSPIRIKATGEVGRLEMIYYDYADDDDLQPKPKPAPVPVQPPGILVPNWPTPERVLVEAQK